MSLLLITLISISILFAGYFFYGKFIANVFGLTKKNITPACKINDGVDFVPASPVILIGQHFAAIAAVGPIAGPILAASLYGWLPSLLWIAIGAVFIGGVHDFSALVASIRHDAKSVGEVVKLYIGQKAYFLFLCFIWISLLYVIVVFTDLTAGAFVSRPELGEENFGPGVATSSFLYLGLALLMGFCLYRWNWSLKKASFIFIPLVFLIIFLGQQIPIELPPVLGSSQKSWDFLILIYCFIASVIPLWTLLQPRGYLGATILYATFIVGVFGTLFGGFEIQYPALIHPVTADTPRLPIFPLLFTTIACGACSGFHGLVSSGTTSKQLRQEPDATAVGYGGMLLESFVAIVALSTVMILPLKDQTLSLGPDEIYARGLAHFMALFGMSFGAAVTFGKLAFATFIYDTLDVATRLGRYIFQELTGLKGKMGAYLATFFTLLFPGILIMIDVQGVNGRIIPIWKIFWPIFGSTNQLLAALTLLGITVWLKATGKKWWVTALPMLFMLVTTLGSLILIIKPWLLGILKGGPLFHPVGTTAFLLFILALILLVQALPKLMQKTISTKVH
ncbi:MAG: carbon starvation protein A [Elusimicrobia bacterium]|nr:carbon starvation protein A [Elusimicrobiota bacterium]